MNLISWIVLGGYVFIAACVLAALRVGAAKEGVKLNWVYLFIAAIWPLWIVFYLWVLVYSWANRDRTVA